MKTLLSLLLFLGIMVQSFTGFAQTTITIGAGAQSGTQSNNATGDSGPMYRSTASSNFVYSRHHYLYTQAELAAAGLTSGVNITKLAWFKDLAASTNAPATFQIWIKNSNKTTVGPGGQNWTDLIQGSTQVYNNTALTLAAPPQWHEFNFNTPFLYNGDALEISVNFDISAGSSPWTSAGFSWKKDPVTDRTLSFVGSSAPAATLPNLRTVRAQLQLTFAPAGPCTAPPSVGTPTTTASTVCPNVDFTLNATGQSMGAGQTYQWESAPAATGPWTPIGTPLATSSLTLNQTTTTFYRLAITCSGQTARTAAISVTTTGLPVSGTFTIDKNAPASATSFQSIAAAIASLDCNGVNGPVTFNVAPNSGPYNEQVIIPAIPGTSATNKVTLNGNNNVVSAPTSTASRSIFRLDGSDFVTLTGFNIQTTDLTYGWGIHLQNGADNNLIINNVISIASTSTTEANSVGIVLSNSTTTVTTAGNTGNNNVISGNTITGGFKGIHVNGETNGTGSNQVLNNVIKDVYSYGIEVSAANNTLVSGNDISRPLRATTGTMYGIYLSAGSVRTNVTKNRIHNTNDSDPTGTVYPLYITATDAPAGAENVFSNNLIYNINTTGLIYAIYNSSSDNVHYYHNTFDLTFPTNTNTVRGVYQTGAASGIRIINNIFVIGAGTSGVKTGLYFATATTTFTSNNNVLLVNGNYGYLSSIKTTLADWQTATSQDLNSISVDPLFASAATGDLTPTNTAVNNTGQAGTGITTDFVGLTRNPNAPDPGAYEFLNLTNDMGITAITAPNSVCGLTATETVTVTVTNFGTNPQSNVPVSYTLNSGTPVTAIIPGPIAPGANFTFSFPATVNLTAPGAYTFVAQTNLIGDLEPTNNSFTKVVSNSAFATLPIVLNFETPQSGLGTLLNVTNANSAISENAAASLGTGSTRGLLMEGIDNPAWAMPVGLIDPWTNNLAHLSAIKLCFIPAGNPTDPLFLSFDLKQLFKVANANTNFRVTVNGTQVGPTYRPPFNGTPIDWQKIYVDLAAYRNAPSIELALESSVKEGFANGTGTANLIDNIQIVRYNPTGIKENLLAASVNVYPNPSTGSFTVSAPTGKTLALEVTDLTGKVISRQTVNAGTAQVDLNKAAKGIYLLKVTSEGTTATKKLIVQ